MPVFWLATEDHDFAEVNHCLGLRQSNRPVRFEVNGRIGQQRPVGSIAIDSWPVEQLRASLAGLPFGDEVASAGGRSLPPGASMGEAFHRLLERLLKPYGFLFIDPLHPATRQACRADAAAAPFRWARI